MLRRLTPPPSPAHTVNVTPMIDVIMCLIIFFLLVSQLASSARERVALPRSTEGEAGKAKDSVTITVFRPAGESPAALAAKARAAWPARVRADDRECATAPDLERYLKVRLTENPECAVEIRADRSLPWGWVEPVVMAASRAGAPAARLAAERVRP